MAEKRPCPGCGKEVTFRLDGLPRAHRMTGTNVICTGEPLVPGACTCPPSYAANDHHEQGCPQFAPVQDPEPAGEDKGPWFGAMYVGKCGSCEDPISEGDRIRADGTGGYECGACGDSPATVVPDPDPSDWQAQASAAARRHADLMNEAGATVIGPTAAARRHVAGPSVVVRVPDHPAFAAPPSAEDFLGQAYGSMGGAEPMDPPPQLPTAEEFLDQDSPEPKPVMSVSGQPKKVLRDHLDRYAVVLPGETELEVYKSSGNPVGRTRATTFNKAATDKKNINDWGKRNVLIGASRRRDLVLQATDLTHEADRDRLNALVVKLEETAGSKVGSDLGTYLHEFTEYMDAGVKTWQDAPQEFQGSLKAYGRALYQAGLEPIRSLIERTTIIREYGWVCGTFDRIFYHRPSGQYLIGDLKTGKTMDYGKNEVECQLWIYAHGVNQNGIYDWNTRTWGAAQDLERYDPAEWGHAQLQVSESVGVVIHMPVQGPKEGTVELLWADLESGAEHAQTCADVRARPNGKMKPWGNGPAPLAPAPAPSVIDWELVDTADLPWPDRFARVTSSEQASRLWRMAKRAGLEGIVLNTLVGIAQQRLRELGVKG